MNVIVSLRNASVYEVRFQVFLELSAYVNQVTLLTDELDDSLRDRAHSFPKLRVVELGREAFGLHGERWLSEHVVHHNPYHCTFTFGHLVRFSKRMETIRQDSFDWYANTLRITIGSYHPISGLPNGYRISGNG